MHGQRNIKKHLEFSLLQGYEPWIFRLRKVIQARF